MEAGLAGWGMAGTEQVGTRLHPGCGVPSVPYLFIYFSDGSWEGLATGAGRKGWEGGGRGREGRRAPIAIAQESWPERRAGARLRCAPLVLRVGDPAEAGVTMQRKARVAGRGGEQQGRGGGGFCRTRGRGQLRRALSGPRC